MGKKSLLAMAVVFLVTVLTVSAWAVPTSMNYQGRLTDSDGNPLNGSYQASFYLYQVETEGTSLWEEESRTIEVEDGVFSVQLGAKTPLYLDVSDYPALYLEVAIFNNVSAEWEVLSPRQQLTSVVYAFNSEQLSGNTLADLDNRYVNEGQQSIVTSEMIQDGQINSFDIENYSIQASDLYPGAVLTAILPDDGPGSSLDADKLDGLDSSDFASNVHLHNTLSASDGDPADAVYIGQKGSMGIGTTSPDTKVEIHGDGTDWWQGFLTIKNMDNDAGIRLYDGDTADNVRYHIYNKHDSENDDNDILRIAPAGNFSTGGITINQDGQVGIRNTYPTNTLDVTGNVRASNGVIGENSDSGNSGILGSSTYGVYGYNNQSGNWGTLGSTSSGVTGASTTNTTGVSGYSNTGRGVYGQSNTGTGVAGQSNTGTGVAGSSRDGYGVHGSSMYSVGVFGASQLDLAGYFDGGVRVTGFLTKLGGGFQIDHPLDPENKYLNHSFVESPDMKNIYDGLATLDAKGERWVELPEWFEALNKDFRYQLTPIGAPGPNLYIAQKITDNRFKIAGGSAGMEVSWQVTGIRQDPWAEANRKPVEEDKAADELGFYLSPESYGQPEEKGIEWARNPKMMQQVKEERENSVEPEEPTAG